jgi:hypothetical protein
MTTDQGTGGYTVVKCHYCQEQVRFISSVDIEHIDGTPLCREEISHD